MYFSLLLEPIVQRPTKLFLFLLVKITPSANALTAETDIHNPYSL